MATPLTAVTAFGVLKDVAKVQEWAGWRTRNRGSRGDGWGPVNGIMVHHTVTADSESAIKLCRDGHADLPGPLYPILIDKKGTVHLVGWGRCNHAGAGDSDVLAAVIAERYPLPKPNDARTDGNARFYGVALLNMGSASDKVPAAQRKALVNVLAALVHAHKGWTGDSVIGHKEWQAGKIDPLMSMKGLRADVEKRRKELAAPPKPKPTPPGKCS
ncbi:peptidoglycan recognition protein family protein [Streptomyces albidoflavus]|uniref:peptidoglycan recognition protein family protein n=1 Tax=Streptomyces albidoflavus TaxID=1886 RepID=UPI003316FA3A